MTYEIKQARNLFDPLTKNENSVLYEESDLINNLIEKIRQSNYEKDQTFYRIFLTVENEEIIAKVDTIPLTTKFIEKRADID